MISWVSYFVVVYVTAAMLNVEELRAYNVVKTGFLAVLAGWGASLLIVAAMVGAPIDPMLAVFLAVFIRVAATVLGSMVFLTGSIGKALVIGIAAGIGEVAIMGLLGMVVAEYVGTEM